MKKFLAILMVFLAVGGFAFAAPAKTAKAAKASGLVPYVDKGETLVNVGIGWGGLSGGAERTFARVDIADVVPVTFGAAARAFVDPGIFYSWSSFAIGAGAFATAHVGFKGLDLPSGLYWISHCDTYAGLGLGFASATAGSAYSSSYYTFKPGIGISTFEGVSYYLNDKLALNFEYGYIGAVKYSYTYPGYEYTSTGWPLYYSTFGVIFKL